MDPGIAGSAAGIDPKVINNVHPDTPFSLNSWKQSRYSQQSDWNASQDSSPSDGDLLDMGAYGPVAHDVSLLARSDDFQSLTTSQVTSPKFSLPDGTVEGTISGTVSPTTLPSSTDDNFHPDESWPRFKLFNSSAAGMSMDPSLFYQYAKEPAASADAVIVDDPGDMANGHGLPESHSDFMCFQNMHMPPIFPFATDSLAEASVNPTAGDPSAEESIPLSTLPPVGAKEAQEFPGQASMQPLGLRGSNELAPNVTSSASFMPIPQDLGFDDGPAGQDSVQYKSESSSASGDIPGLYEFPYSGTGGDAPAFADRSFDGDSLQYGKWSASDDDAPSQVPQHLPNTAFMVGEELPEFPVNLLPSRSKTSASQRAATKPPLALQSAATVRKRKQRSSGVSDQNPSKPLQIVQEDGQGGSVASSDFISPPRGARRKGPLTTAARANAGLRRKNKDTCVQCRLNKRKCDGHSPCDACRPTLHEQPCARACFASIVEYGTCNYISQRAINHPTMDGSGRVRMDIPSEFNLNDLLSLLSERQGQFNIRASQSWGSLYVLDLGETYRFMKSLSEYNGNSRSTFLEFIDRRLVESKDRSKNWLSCVKECDPMNNVYTLLSQWNNMPSRASYSFISDSEERPMDINNPADRREILLAAQLSRIFCRMLEVEGFRKLERDFYNIKWKQISHETYLRFLKELGHILLSLRWRVSWWKRLGDGGQEPDPSQQHYVDRVDLLCRILYVYYTSVLAKLPSWSTTDVPRGIWSHYADSENAIWDDFPMDSTDGGFQRWMERGRELIAQAGVHSRRKNF